MPEHARDHDHEPEPTLDPSSVDFAQAFDKAAQQPPPQQVIDSAAFLPPRVARYTLVQDIPLGRGGAGTAWLFRSASGGELVVIKVPRPEALAGDGRAGFEAECAKLLKLRHENVVRAIERVDAFLADGSRVPALVMEYVVGELLSDYVARAAPSPRELLELFERICNAAEALHHVGVVHLDLKPSNIKIRMTGSGPVPVILDLGSSKVLLDRETRHSGLTLTFASPEQLEQHEQGTSTIVDTSSDVYSLAKILAWLFGGEDAVEAPRGLSEAERLHWLQRWSPRRMDALTSRCDRRILRVVADATRARPSERLRAWRVNRERGNGAGAAEHATAADLCGAVAHAREPWWRLLHAGWHGVVDSLPMWMRRGARTALLSLLACVVAVLATNAIALTGTPTLRPWLMTVTRFDHVRVVIFPPEMTSDDVISLAKRLEARPPDPTTRATWRAMYGKVGELCAAHDAKVVGFDLEIGERPAVATYTADLVASVERMGERGCQSVFGLWASWTPKPISAHFDPRLDEPDAEATVGCFETSTVAGGGKCIVARVERETLPANAFSTELVLAWHRARLVADGVLTADAARLIEMRLAPRRNEMRLGLPPDPESPERPAIEPIALTLIGTFGRLRENWYRDAHAEPNRVRIDANDTVGLLWFMLPAYDVLWDNVIAVKDLLDMSDEKLDAWLGGKVVILANATSPVLTGEIGEDTDMEPYVSEPPPWWAWMRGSSTEESDEGAGRYVPKAFNNAVPVEIMLAPAAPPWSVGQLLFAMVLAAAVGVLLGARIARRRPRWARQGAPDTRARAAVWTVAVTAGAVASFIIVWVVITRLRLVLPFDAVIVAFSAAIGLLLGWLAARVRSLSNSFDAWLDGSVVPQT